MTAYRENGFFLFRLGDPNDPHSGKEDVPWLLGTTIHSQETDTLTAIEVARWAARQWMANELKVTLQRRVDANKPAETIREIVGSAYEPGRKYKAPLPPNVGKWYCYIKGLGHLILIVPRNGFVPPPFDEPLLLPCPVKTVRRGYQIINGFVYVDLPYDRTRGLLVPR